MEAIYSNGILINARRKQIDQQVPLQKQRIQRRQTPKRPSLQQGLRYLLTRRCTYSLI